jgi:hypothetical protein
VIKVLFLGIGETLLATPTETKKDAHVVVRLRMNSENGSVFDVLKNRFDNVQSMTGEELVSMLAGSLIE